MGIRRIGYAVSGVDQGGLYSRIVCQQTSTGSRCEWHRRNQFGVVRDPGPVCCLGPPPVEYVFSIAVVLQVERHGANEDSVSPGGQVYRQPARLLAYALAFFERGEKSMIRERIVGAHKAIPLSFRDGANVMNDFDFQR